MPGFYGSEVDLSAWCETEFEYSEGLFSEIHKSRRTLLVLLKNNSSEAHINTIL